MSNLSIIIRREYATRVRRRSFILLTLAMPLLMGLTVAVPLLLAAFGGAGDVRTVAVADATGRYLPALTALSPDSTDGYRFAKAAYPIAHYRADAGDIEAVVAIDSGAAVRIYSADEVRPALRRTVEDVVGRQLQAERLAAANVPGLDSIVEAVRRPVEITTVKWDEAGGETESASELTSVFGLGLAFLIYMFVLSYGGMVMQGVMEEKTNRIVEVLVGSVRPFELMMGKLLGVMLVGLTQMAVWGAMVACLLLAGGSAAAVMPGGAGEMMEWVYGAAASLPWVEIVVLFALYFLGGYMLYASFFAAVGAAVNSQEDTQQFMMPVVVVMVLSCYVAMAAMDAPDGHIALWASLFPLTSPIVMMARVPFGVPLWQELLSVALLFATSTALVWAAAKIYRIGILMYGKKPALGDLAKWLRW